VEGNKSLRSRGTPSSEVKPNCALFLEETPLNAFKLFFSGYEDKDVLFLIQNQSRKYIRRNSRSIVVYDTRRLKQTQCEGKTLPTPGDLHPG